MAASKQRPTVQLNSLSKIKECPICMQSFKTPKALPCLHTFCLDCLEKYGQDEIPSDKMSCPVCRQTFVITEEGFDKLPTNSL